MVRAAFAFRDLDEELQTFVSDDSVVHVYQSHSSPPALRTEALKPKPAGSNLSDSMVLKRYVDHNKAQRRRKLLGGLLFVGVALLGALPMLMLEAQKGESQSALELALSAPYKALRVRGEILRPADNTHDIDDEIDPWIVTPDVGDADPHDDGTGNKATWTQEEEETTEEVDEAQTQEVFEVNHSLDEASTAKIIRVVTEEDEAEVKDVGVKLQQITHT